MPKTSLIERTEHVHLKIKDRDSWMIDEDMKGPGSAFLHIGIIDQYGKGCGLLRLYGISFEAMERLATMATDFVRKYRAEMERARRDALVMDTDREDLNL